MGLQLLGEALTFDDVLLVPGYSNVLPKDVCTKTQLTKTLTLNVPLISAAMDTVTEASLAVAMALHGGLGILHKSMSVDEQTEQVRRVKRYESGVVTQPITVSPDTTLAQVRAITEQQSISGLPVLEQGELVGIVTSRDIRFELDPNKTVAQMMTPQSKLITVRVGADREEVIELFRRHRVEKLLVVDDAFHLCGMYTVRDILCARENPLAMKTSSGQLCVGAAVGTGVENHERIRRLIESGVDLLVVDTAHGHSEGVLSQVRWIKQQWPTVQVMGGNIATAQAAKALADAGADAVKVGMGPGSICTTRVVAGVGVPQVTAIADVADAVKAQGVSVVADGGIRFSGDVCKAIAAGANAVMIGGLFAGTTEAPGEVVLYQGRSYKAYRGMGSIGAMAQRHGSSDRYFQDATDEVGKYVPEGIEGRVPFKGPIRAVIYQLMGGLRSSMGYTGFSTIDAMRTEAQFVRISNAGMRESHVHDVVITKEAPNYWVDQ